MKNTKKVASKTNSARSWNKEDYYEYMDVVEDAHNAAKHATVHQYAQARLKVDATETEAHVDSHLSGIFRTLHAHQPAHKGHAAVASKLR